MTEGECTAQFDKSNSLKEFNIENSEKNPKTLLTCFRTVPPANFAVFENID